MKSKSLLSQLSVLALSLSILVPVSQADAQMTRALYERACAVDAKNCTHLRVGGNREFKEPTEAHIALFRAYRDEFRSAARYAGIDARAVLGAIFGENVLNVDLLDYIAENLGNTALCPNGVCPNGRAISFGLGGIQCQAAQAVEPLAARLFQRSQRSDREVCHQVMTNQRESIRYAAAIMREAQDIYQRPPLNLDISRNIGVLTTLFNLGKVEERAAALIDRRRQDPSAMPASNFFGIFVEAYLGEIEDILSEPTLVMDRRSASRNLTLWSRPNCISYPAILGIERRPVLVSGDLTSSQSRGTVQILGEVSCSGQPWSLVRVEDEKIGWIEKQTLIANTESPDLRDFAFVCRSRDSRCERNLVNKFPRNFTRMLSDKNLWEVSLTSLPVGYSMSDFYAGISQTKKAELSSNANFSYSLCENNFETRGLPRIDANQAQSILQNLRQQIQRSMGSRGLNWSQFTPFEDLFYCGQGCLGDTRVGASVFQNQIQPNQQRASEIQRFCGVTAAEVDFREFLTFAKVISLSNTINNQDLQRICSTNNPASVRAGALVGDSVANIETGACRYSMSNALGFLSEILQSPCVETVLVNHYPTYSFLKAVFPEVVLAQNVALTGSRPKPNVFYVQFKQSCSRR